MTATQNIFRTILYNNLLESFQKSYTTEHLKKMYLLTDEEAKELFFFIQTTQRDGETYR